MLHVLHDETIRKKVGSGKSTVEALEFLFTIWSGMRIDGARGEVRTGMDGKCGLAGERRGGAGRREMISGRLSFTAAYTAPVSQARNERRPIQEVNYR
jgi:hypothetical protein